MSLDTLDAKIAEAFSTAGGSVELKASGRPTSATSSEVSPKRERKTAPSTSTKRGVGRPRKAEAIPSEPPEDDADEWSAERTSKALRFPVRLLCNVFDVKEATPEEMQELGEGFAPLANKYADRWAGEYMPEILAATTALAFAAPRYNEFRGKQPEKADVIAPTVQSQLVEQFP